MFFFTPTPLFMCFLYVGLLSQPQNTTVTGDGGGSDEEKSSGDMDVDQDNELR